MTTSQYKKGNIKLENYNKHYRKYNNVASWAIWKEQGNSPKSHIEDTSILINPTNEILKQFNPNIILVGLNISKNIPNPYSNFHSGNPYSNDFKIRHAAYKTMFWGSYMTDIIKDFEEKASNNMMKYINNKKIEKENIIKFEEELKSIGSEYPIIIAFGNDSYKILKRNFKQYNICKVTHYSHFISKEKYREKFLELERELR